MHGAQLIASQTWVQDVASQFRAKEIAGRHRRIRTDDLFAYKEMRDATQSEALIALAAMDAESNLL